MATPKKKPEDLINTRRPTDYRPEYCEKVSLMLDQGKSIAEICRFLRVAKSTLQLWEEKHPEFSAAMEHGRTYSEGFWINLGFENICNKEFNTKIYELNMHNRFGWNKKTENQNTIILELKDIENVRAQYKKDI